MRRLLVAVLTGVGLLAGSSAALYAQPGPPNRFYGSLKIDGNDAPVGTVVTALVNGKECGTRTTDVAGQYWVDVASSGQTSGCGEPGGAVTFRAGSRMAAETAQWAGGVFSKLDLTVSGSGSVPTPGSGASRFTLARLDFTSPCIPASGQNR